MQIQIRKATSADMYAVHGLVQQLAVYEKAAEEVITTAGDYVRDFELNKFDVIVAEATATGEIVGMALYYTAYSTWKGPYVWLEDFVVDERYRGMGFGKLLFEAVVGEATKLNTFLKWQVLDWNEPAIKFYEKYQSKFQTDWITCRLAIPI